MKSEKGFTLIEVVISMAILGIIGAGFLTALAGASQAIVFADKLTTAESLARSQMEYVKNETYASGYSIPIPQQYDDAGYSATIDVDSARTFLQKITITIQHRGEDVLTLEGYKR